MKLIATICTLLSLSLAIPATAQDAAGVESETSPSWFRVELIIFSRTDTRSDEKWPHDLQLAYSPNLVQLIDKETSDEPTIELTAAFGLLSDDQLELNAHARSLARKKDHQLLLHQGWDQPVLSAEDAPSIMITAGSEFGSHKTLEGEIKLSVARYLHLSTNLWLSEFEVNYGQIQLNEWPELPDHPLEAPTENTPEAEPEQEADINTDLELSGLNAPLDFKLQPNLEVAGNSDSDPLLEPYLPSQIIQVKQHRRMRSKELHYLDHPRLGVLVKILPIDTPATAESTL